MSDHLDFEKRRAEVHKRFDPILQSRDNTRQEKHDIQQQMHDELRKISEDESRAMDSRLFAKARRLDIDLPPFSEGDLWDDTGKSPFLSTKGRLTIRKAIDEEQTRRRDVSAWWWKTVIIPALAALTGIVGALTGLAAVLHKR